jgi:hypothetical protein
MPQTTYPFDPVIAIPGMVVDRTPGGQRGRYECSEDLPAGRIAEYNSGTLRLPQSAAPKFLGAVPYNSSLPAGGYKAGEHMVPALRRGLIWLEYQGTAPSPEEPVNIMHSTETATHRGKVTGDAPSESTGAEITAIGGIVCVKVDTTLKLALCEINLPAGLTGPQGPQGEEGPPGGG